MQTKQHTTAKRPDHQCIRCRGRGRMRYKVITGADTQVCEMMCTDCNGTGYVEATMAEQKRRKAAQMALWCRCDHSPGSRYVPDAPRMKHHWVCNACGKITQIG